jgi:hypothetical protein
MKSSTRRNGKTTETTTMNYQIKVEGRLSESWSEWFNGMIIGHMIERDGSISTILTGSLRDKTALHGLLDKIRDLGLNLVSVVPIDGEH